MPQIVTCKKCGFQTTWASAVDWDDEFECSNCSGTRFGRFTNREFITNIHTFYPGNSDGSCTYCHKLYPDGKKCVRDGNPSDKKDTSEVQTKDVHTEHCCSIHGCKYGYDDPELKHLHEKVCSVVEYGKLQSYPCEQCYDADVDEEKYVMRNGKAVLINRAKEKRELLNKIRQFLWVVEHQDIDSAYAKETNSFRNVIDAHQLRVEFDRVFEETGEQK